MKEIILDLRSIPKDNEWVDTPARYNLESIILDYEGKVIRVKITEVKQQALLEGLEG